MIAAFKAHAAHLCSGETFTDLNAAKGAALSMGRMAGDRTAARVTRNDGAAITYRGEGVWSRWRRGV